MKIIPLILENKNHIKQCAMILKSNLKDFSNIEMSKKAIINSIDERKISMIAVDENNTVLGWICGVEEYNAHVWEIQPVVVRKENQRKGIGKILIRTLEKVIAPRGGITIILGTQDENNSTSLSGKDIYNDIFKQIETIKNLKHNTYEFYLKLGYKIVGVIPDSNGVGKPDILMAKRVVSN